MPSLLGLRSGQGRAKFRFRSDDTRDRGGKEHVGLHHGSGPFLPVPEPTVPSRERLKRTDFATLTEPVDVLLEARR